MLDSLKLKPNRKKFMKNVSKKNIKPFFGKIDFLIIGAILSILLIVFLSVKLVFQREKYITVEMVTSGGEWWWGTPHPYYWNVLPMEKGDVEYDVNKKPIFEILDIKKYAIDNRLMGIVKAKIKIKENILTHSYSFKQTKVEIGKTIGVSPNNTSIIGQVIAIDGVNKFSNPEYVVVTAKLYNIWAEEAANIIVGDTVKDSDGHVVVEILNKTELPSLKSTVDWKGNLLKKHDPVTKDVDLTFRVEVRKEGDLWYYQYYQVIKRGISVRLELENTTIEPYIINIEPFSN